MAMPHDASAVTVIDEMLGTHVVFSGMQLKLCIEGALYAPEDRIPEAVAEVSNSTRFARDYVAKHLTRRFGANEGRWPLSARFFLFQQADAYSFSAQPDGTMVAIPASHARFQRQPCYPAALVRGS